MNEKSARKILDAIHEGLEENALLSALGYDAIQGRPGRHLLNNALERKGYGRPIDEQGPDPLRTYLPYPAEWIRGITLAVSGRQNAPLREIVAILRQRSAMGS